MKKLIAAAAALFLIAFSANAQLGVVAGLTSNSTDLKGAYSDIVENQSVTQYHAGIVLKLNLPLGFYVQPGVLYDMKGDCLKDQIATEKVTITTNTGFLEVPVQAGWKLDIPAISPYLFVEPYAGYAITTETKTEAQDAASQAALEGIANGLGIKLNTKNSDEDKWDGRNRVQYGVGVGGGILLLNKLAVSVKWYWDFGNLYNEEGQASWSAEQMYQAAKDNKANGIAVTATLYF
ncbi:MAG: PorT family protein [Bacteroidales bacterium]|nr:PorT family protein [Bacteroidales bacterium]